MPLVKKTYREIANDVLTQVAGGEVTEEHVYARGKPLYRLANTPVTRIQSVEGVSGGVRKIFVKDVDYRLSGESVEWLGGRGRPDEGTRFTVKYLFTKPSGISDLNPGSVVRTVVEAISREVEYLYAQLHQAYLSGFLDTAEGEALDLVVSLLGIRRKPPQPSSGFVTFGRSTEPEKVAITGEVHFYDGSAEYDLKRALVKEIVKVEGTVGGSPLTFEKDVDYSLAGRRIRWVLGGRRPDERTVFRVDYAAYQEIMVPKGTKVSTVSLRPEETRVFTTAAEASLRLTSEGKWEAEAPVICAVPGRSGNVIAGTVTLIPQPVMGIEYVINKGDVTNGVEAEEDGELRERSKHALEFAAKATRPSLESAIKAVEGVSSLLIEDMPEGVSGIVKVIVDGGDADRIQRVIDETRAAGIKVEFSRPRSVYVDVSLTLILYEETSSTEVAKEVEGLIRGYISSLGIGEDVLYSRVVEAAMSVKGVWDVADVRFTAYKERAEVVEREKANIEISSEERANPRTINILFKARE